MAAVPAIYTLSLRGQEQARKARAEILGAGELLASSAWVTVPAAANVLVNVTLNAEPGSYSARQATNTGSNIHENITYIDLGSITHPPPQT